MRVFVEPVCTGYSLLLHTQASKYGDRLKVVLLMHKHVKSTWAATLLVSVWWSGSSC